MVSKIRDKHKVYLLGVSNLLRGPAQSAYSRTERAVTAESGVCTVFDRAPVAEKEEQFIIHKNVSFKCLFSQEYTVFEWVLFKIYSLVD